MMPGHAPATQRRHTAAMRAFRRLRFPLTAWAALALVIAQLAGLAHRIEHPRDLADEIEVAAALAEQGDSGGDTHHDCAAFDAATLSDGPPLVADLGACAQAASARAGTAFRAWAGRAPVLGYASRAPPRG